MKDLTEEGQLFDAQRELLHAIPKIKIRELIAMYEAAKPVEQDGAFTATPGFNAFHSCLYDMHLIFNFDWMSWKEGWTQLNDASSSYHDSTFLELSMYLTAVFRADRFSDGAIDHFYRIGTLEKIFAAMARLTSVELEGN